MERIAMSQEERDWLDWLKRARDGMITQREAAERMGVSERWVRKLLSEMAEQRGRGGGAWAARSPPTGSLQAETQRQALADPEGAGLARFRADFAAEQLAKRHQIQVGKETLREWMIEAGMWRAGDQMQRSALLAAAPSGWRVGAVGHLRHDWLEGRGPVRYLVRMIDDATGGVGAALWSAMRPRRTWGCCGNTWRKTGGWWMCTPIAIPCCRAAAAGRERATEARGRSADATRARLAGAGNRLDSGVFAAGQRTHRAQFPNGPGSFGEATAAGEDLDLWRRANAFLEKEYWPEWNDFRPPLKDFPNHHRALTEHWIWRRFCVTSRNG